MHQGELKSVEQFFEMRSGFNKGEKKVAVLKNGTARTFHAGRSKTVLHRQELSKKAKEIGRENAESSFPPVKRSPLLGSD